MLSTQRPVVLISGGARRIGKAIALEFARRGWRIALHYNQSQVEAKALADQLNQIVPDSCLIFQANLAEAALCHELVEKVLQQFSRIDCLLNNASQFYPTPVANLADPGLSAASFQQLIAVNAAAPLILSRAACASLEKNQGSIINLLDIYGLAGLAEHSLYVACKAALCAQTCQLAAELAPLVRVNGIAPGAILWPDAASEQNNRQRQILEQSALKKLGTAESIAATAAYLAMDATYTTGSIIKVDGGRRWYI